MSDERPTRKASLSRLILVIAISVLVWPLPVWLLSRSRVMLSFALASWAIAVVILVGKWLTADQVADDAPPKREPDSN
jgi:hypothetical protein